MASSPNNNDRTSGPSARSGDGPSILQRIEKLPPELCAMVISQMIRPRILDTRLRPQLPPSVLAHSSQTLRQGYITATQTVAPEPTAPPFTDPILGQMTTVLNLRWFGRRDLLLLDARHYTARTLRVQHPALVQNLGLVMNGQTTMSWGNIIDGLPFLRRVYVVTDIDDYLWRPYDLDLSYLLDAVFEEQFVGAGEGIPGMARVGRIFLNGGDVTGQQDRFLPPAQEDLEQWLEANWTEEQGLPAPRVECRAIFGNIEERFRIRRRETHPRYAEESGFEL